MVLISWKSCLTSGTSGVPLTVYRTPVNIATEQAPISGITAMQGFRAGQPLLSIRGVLGKNTTMNFTKEPNILYILQPNINSGTTKNIIKWSVISVRLPSKLSPAISINSYWTGEKGLQLEIPNSYLLHLKPVRVPAWKSRRLPEDKYPMTGK